MHVFMRPILNEKIEETKIGAKEIEMIMRVRVGENKKKGDLEND